MHVHICKDACLCSLVQYVGIGAYTLARMHVPRKISIQTKRGTSVCIASGALPHGRMVGPATAA